MSTRYPLSSDQGMPIPLEPYKAIRLITQPITTSSMGAALADFDAAYPDIIEVWTTVPAIAGFSVTPINPADIDPEAQVIHDGDIYIPPNILTRLVVPAQYFSIAAIAGRGMAYINHLTVWDTIGAFIEESQQ